MNFFSTQADAVRVGKMYRKSLGSGWRLRVSNVGGSFAFEYLRGAFCIYPLITGESRLRWFCDCRVKGCCIDGGEGRSARSAFRKTAATVNRIATTCRLAKKIEANFKTKRRRRKARR